MAFLSRSVSFRNEELRLLFDLSQSTETWAERYIARMGDPENEIEIIENCVQASESFGTQSSIAGSVYLQVSTVLFSGSVIIIML